MGALTSILPKRNYESVEPQHLSSGTLLKTNSAHMDESQKLSATSRKLQ